MKTVVLRCGDDQFAVSASETNRVPTGGRKRKSLRRESHFSRGATHLFFGWDVKDDWRLFSFSIQQLVSLSVESGTHEYSTGIGTRDCIHTSAIIQIKYVKIGMPFEGTIIFLYLNDF